MIDLNHQNTNTNKQEDNTPVGLVILALLPMAITFFVLAGTVL